MSAVSRVLFASEKYRFVRDSRGKTLQVLLWEVGFER